MDRTEWAKQLIDNWIKDRKTGNIQINFFKGGIGNVLEVQSKKPPKEEGWENEIKHTRYK